MKRGPLALLFAASIAATSCGKGVGSTGTTGAGGLGGSTGTGGAVTGGADAGSDAGYPCGICVPAGPVAFTYPFVVWFGATLQEAPACPANASDLNLKAFASVTAPTECGTCTCGPPSGSCALPATMTANAASCAQAGATTPHTPFDPANGWTGMCDTSVAIASGKLCAGVDCVQSLTVGPLTPNESGCTPTQPQQQQQPPPTFSDYAIGCAHNPYVGCPDDSGSLCIPQPPSGFEVCTAIVGAYPCGDPLNPTPYTERHLVYSNWEDTRACSPCTCGAPSGGTCDATVSVYTDGACSTLAYSATVSSSGPACHDLPPGTPLGSKSATPPTYTPGACTPGGGQPTGAVTLDAVTTVCCIPAQ